MNPTVVAFAPPVAVIAPFKVALVAVILVAVFVTTVGTTIVIGHADVVKTASMPYTVPAMLVPYARK